MTKWKEDITPIVDKLDGDRVRIILEAFGHEVGVLYFEKAKKGWTNKPITQGWVCVDAKVEELYYRTVELTPKELVAWCQELISHV